MIMVQSLERADGTEQRAPALPIRVAFYAFFPGGGIGRYTHELVTHIAQQSGVAPILLCPPDFHWLENSSYPTWPNLWDIRHRVAPLRRMRFLAGQWISPRRAIQYCLRKHIDVIHFSNVNILSAPNWLRLLAKARLYAAATVHDVTRQKAILSARIERKRLRQIYASLDALFVHTDAQRNELADFAAVSLDKIHIVPHGPYDYGQPQQTRDEFRARHGIPQAAKLGLFFGQLRDEKNLELLLRALARCPESNHLLIAGAAGARGHRSVATYREIISELRLDRRVTFLPGHVPDNQVAGLFTASDWIALPYAPTFTSQSGVLNVAVSYDLPVLASDSNAFAAPVSRYGIGSLVPSYRPTDWADAIQTFVPSTVSSAMFANYRDAHSWHKNATVSEGVYRTLVGSDK